MSPTAAMKVAAQITLTPGTVISRRISAERQRLGCDPLLDRRDLRLAEVELAEAAVDGLLLLVGQLERLEPAPALLAEEV